MKLQVTILTRLFSPPLIILGDKDNGDHSTPNVDDDSDTLMEMAWHW